MASRHPGGRRPGAANWKEDRDAGHLNGIKAIYVVAEPDQGERAVMKWLSASRIRARLVYLNDHKDPSALYLDDPELFMERWAAALDAAVPWRDLATAEAESERREAWRQCKELARDAGILDRFADDFRRSGVALSAYVQPIAGRYLARLESGLGATGVAGQLYVMQSNCGVDSLSATREIPITMVESGPASGMWGAAELGRMIGEPNVLALDIGGTTAKCSLIENGHVKVMTDYWIARSRKSSGYPIMVPVVDLVEIGNGGGSIAWVDDFAKLHVGPKSAGASPGPAGYGRGGTEATATDANLALGRIDKAYFCSGAISADMDAVGRALDVVAGKLGVDRIEAARGIVRIANNNMVNALKLVSLNRGYDPRDFTLVAFGGGGMHAVALAQEFG